jgi:hypothetical protein
VHRYVGNGEREELRSEQMALLGTGRRATLELRDLCTVPAVAGEAC